MLKNGTIISNKNKHSRFYRCTGIVLSNRWMHCIAKGKDVLVYTCKFGDKQHLLWEFEVEDTGLYINIESPTNKVHFRLTMDLHKV